MFALDNAESRRIYANVFVDGRKVRFLLDCGSTVNLLPVSWMTTSTVLRPSRAPLRMFDRTELKTLGMLSTVRHPRTRVEFDVEFHVTEHVIRFSALINVAASTCCGSSKKIYANCTKLPVRRRAGRSSRRYRLRRRRRIRTATSPKRPLSRVTPARWVCWKAMYIWRSIIASSHLRHRTGTDAVTSTTGRAA